MLQSRAGSATASLGFETVFALVVQMNLMVGGMLFL